MSPQRESQHRELLEAPNHGVRSVMPASREKAVACACDACARSKRLAKTRSNRENEARKSNQTPPASEQRVTSKPMRSQAPKANRKGEKPTAPKACGSLR